MKRRLVTKLMMAAGVAAMAVTTIPASVFAAEDGGQTYGVTYWCESDFFKTVADSITEEAEADGNKTVVVDAQQDSAKQIQIIEDFIAQGVSAVFLNPVDKDAIEPALQKLDEAGIPVVNFDTSVSNLDLVGSYVATDNYQAGALCAEAMIEDFPDGGEIAVLDYPANNACNDREQGFLDTIEGKGFDVVATFDAEGTVEKGQTITSDIIQANPDIKAIFSPSIHSFFAVFSISSKNFAICDPPSSFALSRYALISLILRKSSSTCTIPLYRPFFSKPVLSICFAYSSADGFFFKAGGNPTSQLVS